MFHFEYKAIYENFLFYLDLIYLFEIFILPYFVKRKVYE